MPWSRVIASEKPDRAPHLTAWQLRVLKAWEAFSVFALVVSIVALIPPIGSVMVPHIGWPLFGFICGGTIVQSRLVSRGGVLGYAWARNQISIALAIVILHGAAQIVLNWNVGDAYNPYLRVSAIQPLVTIGIPLAWLTVFWSIASRRD